jgi:hypothetical protein
MLFLLILFITLFILYFRKYKILRRGMKAVICFWIGLSALAPVLFAIVYSLGRGLPAIAALLFPVVLYLLPYIVHKLIKQA